jgi:polyhydroxyalkanoate synthesis regulator phasin
VLLDTSNERNVMNTPHDNPRPNRRSTVLGATAGLLGGGAIGLLLAMPTFTSAATQDPSTTDTTEVVVADDSESPDVAPGSRIRESLQELVDDGTITAAQADAVAEHLASSFPGRTGPRHRHQHPAFDGEVLAELLGIDVDTLRTELRAGKTVAEIATEQGVDPQTVIDALVAEAESHLDLSVENGRLTQEEADAQLQEVIERVTDRVENGRPARR